MRKKGFTLIELLAVIVILAIIAVITIPTVMKVIENSKKGAAERSTENYVGAVENAAASYMMNHQDDNIGGTYTVGSNDSLTGDNDITLTVKVKGNKPAEGSQLILNENGILTGVSNMTIDGYNITYDTTSHKFTASKGSSGDTPVATTYEKYNAGDLVYFDPVSDSSSCSSDSDVYSSKRTVGYGTDSTSTCYKWRVIEVDDSESKSTITLQMDHNLINTGAWSPSTNTTGPVTALKSLNVQTTSWTRVEPLTYEYDTTAATSNYGKMSCTSGTCTLNETAVEGIARARMITGEEVRDITNTKVTDSSALSKNWTVASSYHDCFYFSHEDNTELSWLAENTTAFAKSGTTSNTYEKTNYGYWTLSPISDDAGYTWIVYYSGSLNNDNVTYDFRCGIRPVVTVDKSYIE